MKSAERRGYFSFPMINVLSHYISMRGIRPSPRLVKRPSRCGVILGAERPSQKSKIVRTPPADRPRRRTEVAWITITT